MMSIDVATTPRFAARDDVFRRAQANAAVSVDTRFENLLDRHERRVRRLVFGMLGDADRLEDVLQEIFLKAYRGLPARFENDRVELAWLCRIAQRCCLNEIRRRDRRRESPGLPDDSRFASVEERDRSLLIASALRELRPRTRAVIVLVDLLGLDYEAAAKALRVPSGTVASRLHKARTELRAALLRAGVDVDA